MKYCPQCAAQNEDRAIFCLNCGTELEISQFSKAHKSLAEVGCVNTTNQSKKTPKNRKLLIVGIAFAILVLIVLAVFLCVRYYSMRGTCGAYGDNLTWVYDGDFTLTISGTGEMEDYIFEGKDIRLPEWTDWDDRIRTVNIEEGVTTIGDYAFFTYPTFANITRVKLPNSLKGIGEKAFSGCALLTDIDIPDNVLSIGDEAFADCTGFKSIELPDKLDSIGMRVFKGCTNLERISIPDHIETIGGAAFSNCSSLTSITLPTNLKAIGGSAFEDCESLTSITLPTNLKAIGGSAFKDCKSLESIIIPDHVTTIEAYTFENCSALTSIVISSNIKTIERWAFMSCSSLSQIIFSGDAPSPTNAEGEIAFFFHDITATAYYPSYNDTWNDYPAGYLGGDITWEPYNFTYG